MRAVHWITLWVCTCLAMTGCGGSDHVATSCQTADCELDAGAASPVTGARALDAKVRVATFQPDAQAAVGSELQVHVQVNGARSVCGTCSVVLAQVQGGTMPYSYSWSDPTLSGPGPHTVCPAVPTTYDVVVTDNSQIASGDMILTAQSAEASGDVACVAGDAATPGEALTSGCTTSILEEPDAGADGGTATNTCGDPNDAGIVFDWTTGAVGTVEGWSKLTQYLKAGQTYEYSYDRLLPFNISYGDAVQIEFWGASGPCQPVQKFFELTLDGLSWHQDFCLTPQQDFSYIDVVLHLNGVLFDGAFVQSQTFCTGCSMGAP